MYQVKMKTLPFEDFFARFIIFFIFLNINYKDTPFESVQTQSITTVTSPSVQEDSYISFVTVTNLEVPNVSPSYVTLTVSSQNKSV